MRPDLAAYTLAALCVVAIVVLSAIGAPVPDVLPALAVGAFGAGAGVAIPTPRRTGAERMI